jgi:hypothetical protein
LLGIFSEPARVPLELFALQSGSDAYLSAVEIVGRRDWDAAAAEPREFTAPRRTHEALLAAGASQANTAWAFPLRETGLPQSTENVLALWNHWHEDRATEKLEEHLVRQIRQWRPDVIVTEDVSPRGDNPLAHLTNQVTLAAASKAREATAYPEQLKLMGLEPWQVKKVLTLAPGDKQGAINITPAQWSPRLGRSLADAAGEGRSLLTREVAAAPRNIGLSILVDHLPQQTGRRDVMSGITLGPGGEARRQLANPPAGDLEELSRLAQKRHNIEQLLARVDGGGSNLGNWIGQIEDLTRGLSERQSGEIIWQLSQRYLAAGRSEPAAEALQLLLNKHPQHPLADRAALWLLQSYASSEVAWRHRKTTHQGVRLVTAIAEETQASGASPAEINGWKLAERAGRAIALAKLIERTRPTLHADPAFTFPLSAALRHTNQSRGMEQMLQRPAGAAASNPWAANAAAEEWIKGTLHQPPKPLLSVVRLANKPKLDGRLDDAVWQTAKAVALKLGAADAAQPATTVLLAYDEEFLYFAASCQKFPGLNYQPDERARVPDENFGDQDHLKLMLDLDRDYASYWQLALDSRGRPAESCHGDATWNPEWYIAAGGDDQWWTIEAAIPLAELGPKLPEVRDVWAVGIQRMIPRSGLQAFSQPAAIDVRPEGFGLLVFE